MAPGGHSPGESQLAGGLRGKCRFQVFDRRRQQLLQGDRTDGRRGQRRLVAIADQVNLSFGAVVDFCQVNPLPHRRCEAALQAGLKCEDFGSPMVIGVKLRPAMQLEQI